MPEPTVASLKAELATMKTQMAEFLATQSDIKPGPLDAKLVPQPELDRQYQIVRDRNLKTNWLADAAYKAGAKDADSGMAAELATANSRIAVLEQLVLEQHAPTPAKTKGK